MDTITTAVFPVAGIGTRLLPATKALPKEMLPVVDKPLIQYAVEEAVAAGITRLIFIINKTKHDIADHFDRALDLEIALEQAGKTDELTAIKSIIPAHVSCSYVLQTHPLGLGHALLCAQAVVSDRAFLVMLPDDLIDTHGDNASQQLIKRYQETNASVIAVEEVATTEVSNYGIVAVSKSDNQLARIDNIIEKPQANKAPSNLAVIGRYVFDSKIFACLEAITKGVGGELQLTDAIQLLMREQSVYAYNFEGVRYDCGTKLGYLKAIVHYALKDKETKTAFNDYVKIIK